MRILPTLLAVTLTGGLLSAQDALRCSSSLTFRSGAKIAVAHNFLDLAQGVTLKNILDKGPEGKRYRDFFNADGFTSRIAGALHLGKAGKIGEHDLDAGKYVLTFKVDEDLVWHGVILNGDKEEICSSPMKTKEVKGSSQHLVMRPIAADNKTGKGHLEIHFGHLVAHLPFHCK